MRPARILLAVPLLAVPLLGPLLGVPVPARAAELGGFTIAADAAPVAIQIFEPTIPVPAEPQLELNLSYSRAKLSSGPTGQATSSLMWPGDGVGYGLPELLQNPDAKYPVKVDAAAPSGPEDAEQELAPGVGMTAHADGKAVESAAYMAKPATPTLPVVGLPIPPVLVAVESFSSHSRAAVSGDKATATSYATAGSVSLLGGLVKVNGLRVDAEATSDGSRGASQATVAWKSLTLAGTTFAATQDGVKSPVGVMALPKLPAAVSKRLAELGLSIDVPAVNRKDDGTAAKVTGQGLTVTLDTAVLRNKLDPTGLLGSGGLLDPVLALLPAELRTQLLPLLDLAPRFVFVTGVATSQATATPAYAGGAPPADPGPAGGSAGVSGDGGGGGVDGAGDVPGTEPAGPNTPVASARQWPAFPGVPWYLFVLGVGFAAAVSYGLRRFVGLMFAAAGCDLGAGAGVPNLRALAGRPSPGQR